MKIVYLAAGAAGMYCGSCLHDNTLAAALLSAGEDVLLVPTYTPIRTDEEDVSQKRLFFGGINVYLQQKSVLFRHTPWFVDALLDSPGLIGLATRGASSVDASRLGDLTVSMLAGEDGRQRKELAKLVRWLATDVRPDVVHLSNALLLGMARQIRGLGAAVVCGLSGEDIFLDRLTEPYKTDAQSLLRERAGDVDAFVALNHYYADRMAEYLAVDRKRIHVIRPGLNLAGHGTRPADRNGQPATIGYLARICPAKGLHNLVAACELLLQDSRLPQFRVKAAGYLAEADKPYLEFLQKQINAWPDPNRFQYAGELTRHQKIDFLQSLDVMSVPTVYQESKGLSLVEALANGVPIVQPAHGTFPELIADTGGGLLCQPEDPVSLAAALRELITEPARAIELGRQGQAVIHARYSAHEMARQTLGLYREVAISRKS